MLRKFPKIKESGQSDLEFAIVVVLIAIIVFACVMIFGPLLEGSSSSEPSPASILVSAPIIDTTEMNPIHVSLSKADGNSYKVLEYEYGCHNISVDSAYSIRAGTEYADVSRIRIKRLDKNHYSVCVDVKGVKAKIYYELVKQ